MSDKRKQKDEFENYTIIGTSPVGQTDEVPERAAMPSKSARNGTHPSRIKLTNRIARRRRARRKALLILFMTFLAVFGTVFTVLLIFRVEGFRVEGETIYTDSQITSHVPILPEENIFTFSTAEAERAIESSFVYIEDATVRRSLPSTVVVTLVPSIESYSVQLSQGRYLLSQNLRILRPVEEGEVFCSIIGVDSTTEAPGGYLAPSDAQKLELLTKLLDYLKQQGIHDRVTEINLSDPLNISFNYDGRVNVLLGSDLALDYKIELVTAILQDEIQSGEYGTLDATSQGRAVFSAGK